jgi:Alkylmercury lyase
VATLEIRTAEELADPALEARWAARRAARETDVLQKILRTFVERGGPIPVEDVIAAFHGRPSTSVHVALAALDADDLIRVRDGQVDIAYPFSAVPAPFVVRLPDGTERYTCCATDALGIAPMLGQRVHIGSRCHHCKVPLGFTVSPDGPGPGAEGVMVWFGKTHAENEGRALDSL